MNVLKQTINRAKQTVTEQLGTAEKTELDPELTRLLHRAEEIKLATEKILSAVEAYIQPDPSQRLLPGMMVDGVNKPEAIGQEMSLLSTKLGAEDPYGKVMIRGGETFHKLGQAEREFIQAAQAKYVTPMRRFLAEEVKLLDGDKRELNNKRLDMDALKGKGHKGAEPELKAAEEAFNKSIESVRARVAAIDGKLVELQKFLKDLIEADLELCAKKQQLLGDLKKFI